MRSPQKTLIVQVMGYYPPHIGGAEKVTQQLAEHLATRGQDVLVLTSTIDQPLSITTSPVPHLRVKRLKTFEFAHTPFMPGLVFKLLRLPKYSIIHLHLAQAYYPELVLLVAKIRRIPYVLHFHLDLQPSGSFGRLFLLYKAVVLPRVIRGADKVIVFSVEQQRFIHQRYGVALQDVVIIPNGVGEEFFMPPRITYQPKAYQLLYVGRLAPQKRVHILLEAMSLLKMPAFLTIIGDGEDRSELEQLARKYKLTNISFEGFKTPAELVAYYRQADVFVLSSEREGMPLVALEAMAAGLPVVAGDVPGLHELLQNVGLLIADPSGQSIADALDGLFSQPQELAKLSKNSAHAATAYSWTKVTDAVMVLYRDITKGQA